MSVHMNLGSHNPDLSRNHKVLEELTSLVEATERAAFTTSSAAGDARSLENCHGQSVLLGTETPDPQIHLSAETAQESVRGLDASTVSQSSPEHPNDQEAREYREKFPFGADLADNACRESFQNQFGGEEE